ncbi:MAG: hypothetical protein NT013_25295 [Planctomycetia bacterium]|nr:hypothetical protein [Planctomycetia bacterium]
MRIDGESYGSPLFGRRPVRPGAAGGSRRASSSAQPSSSSATSSSRENSELKAQLQELPEVRADVLEDVRQRLHRGELLTREAAEATATAILSDLQAFLRL